MGTVISLLTLVAVLVLAWRVWRLEQAITHRAVPQLAKLDEFTAKAHMLKQGRALLRERLHARRAGS